MSLPVLTANNISKIYPINGTSQVVAIQNLSLEINEGEFVCIIGASGCGKSTLLNMFAGFLKPTSGDVRLRGEPIQGIEPRCGMVFQSYALFPWKTVRGNVEFGLKMQGISKAERHRIADEYIDLVKLTGFGDRYPTELSGGMQQRVTLARILAANPEVLLMDEPFAALDAMTRQVLQEELLRIHDKHRKTTVFITHNIDEALVLADRIVVLSTRPGQVKEVFENNLPRPRHITVQFSKEFAEFKSELWGCIEEEVNRHVDIEREAQSY